MVQLVVALSFSAFAGSCAGDPARAIGGVCSLGVCVDLRLTLRSSLPYRHPLEGTKTAVSRDPGALRGIGTGRHEIGLDRCFQVLTVSARTGGIGPERKAAPGSDAGGRSEPSYVRVLLTLGVQSRILLALRLL